MHCSPYIAQKYYIINANIIESMECYKVWLSKTNVIKLKCSNIIDKIQIYNTQASISVLKET